MSSPVGGRLESAPTRPVTDRGDRRWLVLLVLAAAAVHAVVVARTAMTARDGVGFARTALQLGDPTSTASEKTPRPTPFDVLRQPGHPPGYPAALLLASTVTHGDTTQDRLLLAGQLVSAIAGTLLVVPLYWLGRTLFGQPAGFAGALLFTVLPVAARYTSDVVTEGLYLLLLATALLLGTRAVRKPTVGGFLLCGLSAGAAYLVRPEGALAAAAVGAVVVLLAACRRQPVWASAGRLAALTVGFLLVTGWYMAVIGGLTNKPSVGGILGGFQVRQLLQPTAAAAPAGPAVFASWQAGGLAEAVKELAKEGSKSFHYVPPAFALLGLFVTARRLRADSWLLVPLAFVGLMLPVLIALGLKEGYISERHTLSVVLVLCPFAAAGFQAVGRWAGRPWVGWVLFTAVVVSCLPLLSKPLHRDRLGHKLAGEYLAKHAHSDDIIIDPWDWAAFYSGRTLKGIPDDPKAAAGRSRWAVIEPKDMERSEKSKPRLQAARDVMNDGKNPPAVAFQWPEGVPLEEAKVVLYRQTVK